MAGSSSNVKSNLVSFIDSVTPVVPLKPIPEDCVDALNKVWQPVGGPITEYFTLEDLWKRFNKWSVYGVKTPVALANGQHIMQHFSPFLSAMQIYTNTSSDIIRSATEGTAEDGSKCDYLIDEDETSSNSTFSRAWDEASSNDNDESLPTTNCRNNLYMKFSDSCPPYWRVPFCQKIKELAKQYPALMTLRSTDLSPASWMSVAWYPIYPIPSKGSVKDFSAAFLSFHTLSSYFQDVDCTSGENGGMEVVQKGSMSLAPFGLASYMLVGDVWLKDESDGIRMHTLHRAAGSWLKQLDFYNHDFTFFCVKSGLQLL